MVAVETAHLRVELGGVLPCFGHEHRHGVADVAPAAGEQLDRVVELARVRVVGIEQGPEEVLGTQTGGLGAEACPGPHTVLVALDRVDLAVVAEHAERLGPFPCGQRVGGVPLVEDGERGLEALVGEVEVEVAQLVGGREALEHDAAERARGHVDAGGPGDPAPQQVGTDLVGAAGELGAGGCGAGPVTGHRVTEHHVNDGRLAGTGEVAEAGLVGGWYPPLHELEARIGQRSIDRCPRVTVADEERGDTVALAEEGRGQREQHPAAIRGERVRGDGAAVLDVGEPVECGRHDLSGRPSLRIRHEADATRVEFAHRTSSSPNHQLMP